MSYVLCYHLPVTFVNMLKEQSGVWSFCDSCPESYVWTWSSEISINSNFQTIWHAKAEAVEFSFSLSALRQMTFDLCFQGHDPPLISFHPAIVIAELSLYDTPRYVLFESGNFLDSAHQALILWFLLWPYSIYATLLFQLI